MFSLNCKGRMVVAELPMVMGIINITPDSFYDSSRAAGADEILNKVEKMVTEGADIIDIGAQSTRPHSAPITEEEELLRLSGTIENITKNFPDAIISIDTYFSRVARECVLAGASIVNDISGGSMDKQMIKTVGALHVPYVCTHMRGTPQTMHEFAQYDDLVASLIDYFIAKIDECNKAGITDVIIDPGFGFSKTIAQNFELLKNLNALKIIDKPVLAGLSRKSTIYKTLAITAGEALNGTTVLNTAALLKGAEILRVHDVKEARECISLVRHLI